MKKLVVLLLLANCAFAADLQKQLDSMAATFHGKVALFAKNLKTGATVAIRADEPVQTASVIKLPIMVEAMYEVQAGKHRLDERLKLTKDNQVEGSGVLMLLEPGLQPTLQDAITLMIVLSDNTATNVVIDAIGIPAVNARLAAMGLKNTYLYKKVSLPPIPPVPPEQKKFGLGKTTAREMAEVMESIQRCDLKDAGLCAKMLEILRNQQDRCGIPRYIEFVDTSETPAAVANKTGALDDVRNDVALVTTKSAPIIISAFTWDNQDQRWTCDNGAQLLIARMAEAIVKAWSPKGVAAPAQ
jgi:beta-lactamase class A